MSLGLPCKLVEGRTRAIRTRTNMSPAVIEDLKEKKSIHTMSKLDKKISRNVCLVSTEL